MVADMSAIAAPVVPAAAEAALTDRESAQVDASFTGQFLRHVLPAVVAAAA